MVAEVYLIEESDEEESSDCDSSEEKKDPIPSMQWGESTSTSTTTPPNWPRLIWLKYERSLAF